MMGRSLGRQLAALCLAIAASSWTPVRAHHSFTAVYRIDQTIEIEGEVAQFQFRNPHVLIHILVPDGHGEKVRWAAEWLNVTQLALSGVSAQTFRPGDEVTITVSLQGTRQ